MEELISGLESSLNPTKSAAYYVDKLTDKGYFTPLSVKAVDTAEKLERDCGFLPGEAAVIWKAAGGGSGTVPDTVLRLGCDSAAF